MRTYNVQVTTDAGRRRVNVRTSAETRAGVLRAVGRAIANDLRTDVFECRGMMWREGVARDYQLNEWRNDRLTASDERGIWQAAHDALMAA